VIPLSPSLFQSAQGLRYFAYVAPQFSARVFSAWEHHIVILSVRSTPSMRRPIPVKSFFCSLHDFFSLFPVQPSRGSRSGSGPNPLRRLRGFAGGMSDRFRVAEDPPSRKSSLASECHRDFAPATSKQGGPTQAGNRPQALLGSPTVP
jgi:hypothetical protein